MKRKKRSGFKGKKGGEAFSSAKLSQGVKLPGRKVKKTGRGS